MRLQRRTATQHTTKKATKEGNIIEIIHPFHPDAGKKYEYVCKTKFYGNDYVTCTDKQGKCSIFPASITNLHTTSVELIGSSCAMTIEDFMKLKELTDDILRSNDM